uniref:Flavin-containing monooxygenase n=1 Tax=Parascaris equorum TaxID=6256 RepID=A0A914R191_PAREQ
MRVCVIGTGVSGLPAIKECRAAGFEDASILMKSTVCKTSKEMMAYSDFPPSANYPNFMHNSLIREYLQEYAENFDLLKEIRFSTSVEKVHYFFHSTILRYVFLEMFLPIGVKKLSAF